MPTYRFNVLITADCVDGQQNRWIAQCLEHDIACEAQTPRDAMQELKRMIVGRIITGAELELDPFAGVPAAPAEAWTAWAKGLDLTEQHAKAMAIIPNSPRSPMAVDPELHARIGA